MPRRKRRIFTTDFKAEVVRLSKVGDRSVTKLCKDLDLTESSVRGWIEAADATSLQAAEPTSSTLSVDEREELKRLRRDNQRLLMERDILKKAAAFFAKEST